MKKIDFIEILKSVKKITIIKLLILKETSHYLTNLIVLLYLEMVSNLRQNLIDRLRIQEEK